MFRFQIPATATTETQGRITMFEEKKRGDRDEKRCHDSNLVMLYR
jgi:hypothetical protein